MSVDIGNRIRRLGWCDRLLLLLLVVSTIAGISANYERVHGPSGRGHFWILAPIIWAAVAGVIAYSVVRQQRRPAGYGFSFRRGGLASLALVALIHVYLLISGRFVSSTTDFFVMKALGAFIEEVLFRVVAIEILMLLMHDTRAKVFWAILASSVLWSIPHAVSVSPGQLFGGIFLGGLLFGYIYYKSRSILLPAWIHSVANAGHMGGVLVVAVYCVIAGADCAMGSRNKKTSEVAVASMNDYL